MREGQNDQLSPRPFILVSTLLVVIWLTISWFSARAYTSWNTSQVYITTENRARVAIGELYDGLLKSLTFLHAVPELASREEIFQRTVRKFNNRADFVRMPEEELRNYLYQNPTVQSANQELARIISNIDAIDALWLINTDGYTIASSNAGTTQSLSAVHVGDHGYFNQAIIGKSAVQFAVDHQTKSPSLFFSTPVRTGGRIVGALVAKVDLDYLYYWISMTKGYVIDNFGVIVLAANSDHEMMALKNAAVHNLRDRESLLRYNQTEFQTLKIQPWKSELGSMLFTVGESIAPSYILTADLNEYQLKLMVAIESPELTLVDSNRQQLFQALGAGGTIFILLSSILTYLFIALQFARKARAKQELIEQITSRDTLTGLYSRSLSDQLITQAIADAAKNNTLVALLLVDADHFKDMNDSFGHDVGDELLVEMATRCRSHVKQNDIIIRQGGDEFLILLQNVKSQDEVTRLAVSLLATLKRPYPILESAATMTASIGIALYPDNGNTAPTLLRHTEDSLNHVKNKGRADYAFYQPSMSVDMAARKALEADMERALEENEFFLVYQPQYSHDPGGISGCEALIRWRHSSGRLIPPNEFIPDAERSGFIVKLGEWVLDEACRQSNEWKNKLGKIIPISVNLSAIQIQSSDLMDIIRRIIERHNIEPGAIELEVTESMIMSDTKRTLDVLREIKSLGINISIDDFGTGYSSLTYLKKFNADVLKIDRAFIRDIESNADNRSIVNAVISLAKDLDYQVVAEGVESREQFDMLMEMECSTIQGFWYSRPLPADEFATFYMKSHDSSVDDLPPENKT